MMQDSDDLYEDFSPTDEVTKKRGLPLLSVSSGNARELRVLQVAKQKNRRKTRRFPEW